MALLRILIGLVFVSISDRYFSVYGNGFPLFFSIVPNVHARPFFDRKYLL